MCEGKWGCYFLKIAVYNIISVISICLPGYFCELQSFINPSSRNSMDKNKTLTDMLGCKTLYLPLFGAYSPSLCTK